jgi:hypothetical protein
MPDQEPPVEKGEIIPIEFGGKIIAAKRKCTCGGDVVFDPNPAGTGKIARCTRCGAELAFGGS